MAVSDEAFKLFEKYLNKTYTREKTGIGLSMRPQHLDAWEVQKGEENITILLVNLI